MAELQPSEGHINGGAGALLATSGDAVVGVGPAKRQRRPSVRLGDIGGDQQTYDSHASRRTKQQWKQIPVKDPSKGSKTRPLMNLTSDYHETLDGPEDKEAAGNHVDGAAIGSWKVRDSSNKSKRGSATKRVRSNWASNSKIDDGGGDGGEEKFSGGDDEIDEDDDEEEEEEGYRERDFDRDGSDSPLKDPSPIHSLDNMNLVGIDADRGHRRDVRVRVSDGPSDTDARNWNNNQERNGVRVWLNQLGLGRYAPVFEIHEVDDEVLPLLTLEDLKDMGINAVGSRRKMYSSIQKLGKGFS